MCVCWCVCVCVCMRSVPGDHCAALCLPPPTGCFVSVGKLSTSTLVMPQPLADPPSSRQPGGPSGCRTAPLPPVLFQWPTYDPVPHVLKYLPPSDLCMCQMVCQAWEPLAGTALVAHMRRLRDAARRHEEFLASSELRVGLMEAQQNIERITLPDITLMGAFMNLLPSFHPCLSAVLILLGYPAGDWEAIQKSLTELKAARVARAEESRLPMPDLPEGASHPPYWRPMVFDVEALAIPMPRIRAVHKEYVQAPNFPPADVGAVAPEFGEWLAQWAVAVVRYRMAGAASSEEDAAAVDKCRALPAEAMERLETRYGEGLNGHEI